MYQIVKKKLEFLNETLFFSPFLRFSWKTRCDIPVLLTGKVLFYNSWQRILLTSLDFVSVENRSTWRFQNISIKFIPLPHWKLIYFNSSWTKKAETNHQRYYQSWQSGDETKEVQIPLPSTNCPRRRHKSGKIYCLVCRQFEICAYLEFYPEFFRILFSSCRKRTAQTGKANVVRFNQTPHTSRSCQTHNWPPLPRARTTARRK